MRLLLILLAAAVAEAGEHDDARNLFVTRCASCHTVPDPGLRTDLAWIDQIFRTT